ncbi:DNA mismatch repair endonuclease MutH [Psychrosphaera algicola]|uniref:DNA mismatch repair protein MutH n=1 Tax=Psychrosphaera algicola TaxID=3023714 RepID=A0ABT5FIY9_9GAMM|nr:DNA mismatch repair endonuclease MutH [Psychrosphaera sp. G1-22]MDC2891169.1 DNA mismatch repair endonuclease MutH [Psychrosphaera sp. G1-22]
MITIQAPKTLEQLMHRMDLIAGLTIADIAEELQVKMPENLQTEKGWVGQLVEAYLGATAGNLPEPDFQHLGIELKTIPISRTGAPLETTYVCVAPLSPALGEQWRTSLVYKKLAHVLWVPIIAERSIPLKDRQIAMPFLWQMTPEQEQILKTDWGELTDLIVLGKHDEITAKLGEALQLRPKAADSSVRSAGSTEKATQRMRRQKGFIFAPVLPSRYCANNLI